MGLSREERRALDEMAKRLAHDDPELNAVLSGSPTPRPGSSPFQVWCMLLLMTCAVFMMGIVMWLSSGPAACTGLRSVSCTQPSTPTGT